MSNINFSNTSMPLLAAHFVGNPTLDEDLTLSEAIVSQRPEQVDMLLMQICLQPFRNTTEFHHFYHHTSLEFNQVFHIVEKLFDSELENFELQDLFVKQSQQLAKVLYDAQTHPKTKAGDVFIALFKDVGFEDEVVDCIGIFKHDRKEKYLISDKTNQSYQLQASEGLSLDGLDKACLIFNTEKDKGYVVAVVDKSSKTDMGYWKHDFLHLKVREDQFYHTKGYLNLYHNFIEGSMKLHYDMDSIDEITIKQNALNYFKEKETFDFQEFANDVIQQPEIIDKFRDYKNQCQEDTGTVIADEFNISTKAVKGQEKHYKKVLKLDRNFHVYIHNNGKTHVERGTDEVSGMKFIKLLYSEEA